MRLFSTCAAVLLAAQAAGSVITHKLNGLTIVEHPDQEKRDLLQEYVRFNLASIFNTTKIGLIAAGDLGREVALCQGGEDHDFRC
jgi:beta-galactosidase